MRPIHSAQYRKSTPVKDSYAPENSRMLNRNIFKPLTTKYATTIVSTLRKTAYITFASTIGSWVSLLYATRNLIFACMKIATAWDMQQSPVHESLALVTAREKLKNMTAKNVFCLVSYPLWSYLNAPWDKRILICFPESSVHTPQLFTLAVCLEYLKFIAVFYKCHLYYIEQVRPVLKYSMTLLQLSN